MPKKNSNTISNISTEHRALKKSVVFLQRQFGSPPQVAVVFGSGLGGSFLSQAKIKKTLLYEKIPGFGKTSVEGHAGQLHWLSGKKSWILLQGRKHLYEGISAHEVVFPYRALALWGVTKIIITNASGSLRPGLKAGSLAWIKDHLNFTGTNPLIGENLSFLGPRFPSLHDLYLNPWSQHIRKTARSLKIPLQGGVYVGLAGPSYETPAEVKAFARLGGDLVGMSTVLDTIASHHAGMQVAALSAVTNACTDMNQEINHDEVLRQAGCADQKLGRLLVALWKQS